MPSHAKCGGDAWAQVGGNPDNDDGPLGPFYSIGFTEAGGVFYATQTVRTMQPNVDSG